MQVNAGYLSFFFAVADECAELTAVHVVMDGQQVLAVELKCLQKKQKIKVVAKNGSPRGRDSPLSSSLYQL